MPNKIEITGRTAHSDSLTEHILRALGPHMDPVWINAKRDELLGTTRLQVLDWIAFGLDRSNKAIAAESLGLNVSDIQGLREALRQTKCI